MNGLQLAALRLRASGLQFILSFVEGLSANGQPHKLPKTSHE